MSLMDVYQLAPTEADDSGGLGGLLLMDALYRAYLQSSQIPSAAFVVHAIDDDAFRFFRHFDSHPA